MARKPELAKSIAKKTNQKSKAITKSNTRSSIPDENVEEKPFKKAKIQKNTDSAKVKVFYTPENINGFLMEYDSETNPNRLFGLLAYCFKTYQDNPPELLAKVKILTRKSKLMQKQKTIQANVLEHVFSLFKLNGEFYECLFKLLNNSGFVTKIISEFFFKTRMEDNEAFEECYGKMFENLIAKLDSASSVKYSDFKASIDDLNRCENLENFKVDENNSEHESVDEEEEDNEDEADVCDQSSMSLVSLDDEEKIANLDDQLGKMFRNGELAAEDLSFVANLLRCLELLVKANYITEVERLYDLLYMYQFTQFQQQVKFIVKPFLGKFADKKELFKIFQLSSIVIPHVHGLFSTFRSDLVDSFDFIFYVKIALKFNQSTYIFHKIDPVVFYEAYTPSLGPEFDEFCGALISKETNLEALNILLEKGLSEEMRQLVNEAMSRIAKSKERKEKFVKKQNKSHQQKAVNLPIDNEAEDVAEVSSDEVEDVSEGAEIEDASEEVTVDSESEASEEKPVKDGTRTKDDTNKPKKKTFAKKIGEKLFQKKMENRKQFKGTKGDDNKLSPKDLKKKLTAENKKNKDSYKMALNEKKKANAKKPQKKQTSGKGNLKRVKRG